MDKIPLFKSENLKIILTSFYRKVEWGEEGGRNHSSHIPTSSLSSFWDMAPVILFCACFQSVVIILVCIKFISFLLHLAISLLVFPPCFDMFFIIIALKIV
jgi:hypothetical protein